MGSTMFTKARLLRKHVRLTLPECEFTGILTQINCNINVLFLIAQNNTYSIVIVQVILDVQVASWISYFILNRRQGWMHLSLRMIIQSLSSVPACISLVKPLQTRYEVRRSCSRHSEVDIVHLLHMTNSEGKKLFEWLYHSIQSIRTTTPSLGSSGALF